MQDRELLDLYRRLIPFLSELCGASCEIVLHDLTHPERYRSIGAAAAELIRNGEYRDKDYVFDHIKPGKPAESLSGTYFIKNEGRLIGLLCITHDMRTVIELDNVVERLKRQFNLYSSGITSGTGTSEDMDRWMKETISATIASSGKAPERMTREEKIRILQQLKTSGVLNMKGCVNVIAAGLDISVPTAYRYLKELQ